MTKEKETINILGHKIEVCSDEECAQAEFMLCATKETFDENPAAYVPGTKGGYFCMACGKEVILAPSGQKIAALGNNRQVCLACVLNKKIDLEN